MTIDAILLNDWHAVAKVEDLKPTSLLPARLLGQNIVLWRSENQIIMAWQDKCPHRGARLSLGSISGNTLICPYHGFEYDTTGTCAHIPAYPHLQPPARAGVKTYTVQECYGLIWVCLGTPDTPTPAPFAEWQDSSYRKFLCGPYKYQSSGFRAIENFLDVSHFPFVHNGLLGSRNYTAVEDYEVRKEKCGFSLVDVPVWQPDPDGTGKGGKVIYNYRVWRPLTVSFVKETNGNCLGLYFTVTPINEEECLGWMWIAMNYGFEISEVDLRAFQDKVVSQDIPIVESQQPKCLPLDLQAEFHLPCDKGSIFYRRWLREVGVSFGVI